jgi:hypothetical protein
MITFMGNTPKCSSGERHLWWRLITNGPWDDVVVYGASQEDAAIIAGAICDALFEEDE